MTSPIQQMTTAYLEAAHWTDTGDEGQPPVRAEFTDVFKAQAWVSCRNFYMAATRHLDIPDTMDWAQIGYDLWLTRNEHGSGFWDKPEVYGRNTKMFTAICTAMGTHMAEFKEWI